MKFDGLRKPPAFRLMLMILLLRPSATPFVIGCLTKRSTPGALYAAPQRAGEQCSRWSEIAKKHYHDAKLILIDCGGGWYCMSYCSF